MKPRRRCPMRDRLYVELADGGLQLVKLVEAHREALREACAADADIWTIYSSSFDPSHFDASFTTLIGHESRMPYAIVDGERLVGMTAWLRPDWTAQTIEIGNSYIHPDARGTGFGYTKRDGRWLRVRIDHVLAAPRWFAVSGAWLGEDVGSDHLPMVADVTRRQP